MKQQTSTPSKFICFIAVLLISLYCAWSYFFQNGLYALVVSLLSQNYEVYRPTLTIFGLWLTLLAIPMWFAFKTKGRHEYQLKYSELSKRLKIKTTILGLATVVAGTSAVGIYQLSSNAPSETDPPMEIDLTKSPTERLWFKRVTISGRAIKNAAVLTQGNGETRALSITRYTPISSNGRKSEPIKFVEVFSSNSAPLINSSPVSLSGFVMPRSVPVLVKESFLENGIELANSTYLVSRKVYDTQRILIYVSIALGVLTVLLLLRLVSAPFRNRRKLRLQKDHQGNW